MNRVVARAYGRLDTNIGIYIKLHDFPFGQRWVFYGPDHPVAISATKVRRDKLDAERSLSKDGCAA